MRTCTKPNPTTGWINYYLLLCAVFGVLLSPLRSHAELAQLENSELDRICGNSGISIAVKDVQIFQYIDRFRYYASDNGYLELDNIKFNDGTGGPYKLNYDFGTTTRSGSIYFDVGTFQVASEFGFGTPVTPIDRVIASTIVPVWDQDLTYTVGNFIFADPLTLGAVDLGELELGPIQMPSFNHFSSPSATGHGYNWEDDFQFIIDHATYLYQIDSVTPTNGKKITLQNLYIGKSFADLAGDDPRFPATWKPNNNVDFGQFKIGDLFGDLTNGIASNPARLNVAEGDFRGTGTDIGAEILQTPLIGSLRFESVNFGGTDFGPGAVDGIHAYRMTTLLIP